MPNTPKTKKKFKKIHAVLLAVAIALLAGVAYCQMEIGGSFKKTNDTAASFEIPRGAGTAQIADILERNQVVNSGTLFRVYSRLMGWDGSYQFGVFEVVPHASYSSIVQALRQPARRSDSIVVTIPEGYNAFQIAEKLEDAGLCTAEEFITALNTETFDFSFLTGSSEFELVKNEGFLFPDTYDFFPEYTPKQIANAFFENFERRVLTESTLEQLTAGDMDIYELITFASIIQKEAANTKEMYNVASVFVNRMNNTAEYPRLESCTTNDYINNYIFPEYAGNPPASILDAYDTYSRSGLPCAPIANPGLDAIDSALNPNSTPYYFFVTDITFKHYYGRTYGEHLGNIEEAKAVNLTYGKVGL